MLILRFLLLTFNAVVITFLIYHMFSVRREPMKGSKKAVILIGGILLLLAPLGMFFKFFAPTPQYFIIYPIAIGMFIYLTRQM